MRESFAKFDRDTCSWKIPQCLFQGEWALYSETWPRWGMMRGGECWEVAKLEHLTDATESGLWLPTPLKGDAMRTAFRKESILASTFGVSKTSLFRLIVAKYGRIISPCLASWVMGWPNGWISTQPLEMGKFRQWLNSHGSA